jgi:hypothetical protein
MPEQFFFFFFEIRCPSNSRVEFGGKILKGFSSNIRESQSVLVIF